MRIQAVLRRLRRHVGSNLIAYVALFFALSGVAVAAKPLLTGADIQDNTIASADIKDGDIQAVDVKANSLTGSVIDESTLTLPSSAITVAKHWLWAIQSETDPTQGATVQAGDWTLTPTCDSSSLRLAIAGPSNYSKTVELTSGSFVPETAFDKLLPDAQDTSNGISLPSALDVHGSYARTVVPGVALGCELLVMVTAAPEG